MKRGVFLIVAMLVGSSMLLGAKGPSKKDYEWWRKARFGIFIHWGPSSVLAQGGGSWQRKDNFKNKGKASTNSTTPGKLPAEMKKPGWKSKYYAKTCHVPQNVYDNLYQVFNPTEFNAEEWAKTFHDAGANYIVFTTKHHDGFCNFDSSVTDYKITNTPFKRDICKELTDACRKYGIKVIWYYSKPDWRDTRYDPNNPKPYEDYMAKQIEELCTKYGEIKGFWWDGGNNVKVDGKRISDIIFKNQPGAIYNGRGGMSLPGIAFSTPEQKLGAFNRNCPWESCVTMQGEGWFWNGGRNIMSSSDCIKLLINAAVGDGNLLLDFGPTEKGTMHPKIKDNYLTMGKWLKKYGETIYGTRGGPYKPGTWGGATCSGKNVYLHITEVWPSGKIVLPALPAKVLSISALTGGTPKIKTRGNQWIITLDPKKHGNPDTIIKLVLDKDAVAMEPVESEDVVFESLNAVASASSHRNGWNGFPGSVTMLDLESNIPSAKYFGEDSSAVKGKPERSHKYKPTKEMLEKYPWIKLPRDHIWRFWMAKASDKQPWLELDFGKEKTFNKVTILEKFDRIKKYKLMYEKNGKWIEFYSGGALGSLSLALPEALTARKVRIEILDWESDDKGGAPGLREFDFWYDLNGAPAQSIKNYGSGALEKVPEDTKPFLYAKPADLKWFEDAKFGVFIHWDPSSLEKAEISWGRKGPRPGINNPATDGVPQEVYDNLYKKFNPVKFDADAWAKMIRDAGAKYMIFTTKHHGGFCMFDSAETDFDIMSSPYGKDICKQLSDACHKYGIKIFWYYSQPDWHHPEFLSPHHERYRKYMYNQLRELLTNYGKIDGIWFDCLNTKWRHWNTPEMVKMIRTLQPGILINSRWGWDMPGVTDNGDFDNPEQELGRFKIDRPWESCMTMGRGWSWRGGGGVMTPEVCISTLVQCVGSGGNLALDCGPRPDGLIDPPEEANYHAIGQWLKKNGESIYATRGGPFKPGVYGVSTRKGNKIYVHILSAFSDKSDAKITLPPLPKKVKKAYILGGESVGVKQSRDALVLDLTKVKTGGVDTIVVLELDGSAMDIKPVGEDHPVPVIKATASSSYGPDLSPDALVSGGKGAFEAGIHRKRSWVAKGWGSKPQWVVVEFEKPEMIKALAIAEPRSRYLTKEFEVEYDADGTWKPLYHGKSIGPNFTLLFQPLKTKKLRLNILKYEQGDPGLQSFKAFRAD